MKKLVIFSLLFFFLLAIFTSKCFYTLASTNTSTQQNFNSIIIQDDSQFITEAKNNGWLGSGTHNSPFILSFLGQHLPLDLEIYNTDLYFEITGYNLKANNNLQLVFENVQNGMILNNTFIHDVTQYYSLALFSNCSNFLLTNNTFNYVSNGFGGFVVTFQSSQNSTILNNFINNTNFVLSDSFSNIITNNLFYLTSITALELQNSSFNSIINNNFVNNGIGLLVGHNSSNNDVENNKFTQNNYGLSLVFCTNTMVKNNDIYNNNFGITFTSTKNNFIENNTLYGNSYSNLNGNVSGNTLTNNNISSSSGFSWFGIGLLGFEIIAVIGLVFVWEIKHKKIRSHIVKNTSYGQIAGMVNICKYCGSQIQESDSVYCSICGRNLF